MINNLIYTGKIRHRRFTPKVHEFSYNLFMFCFDVDKIDTVFRAVSQVSVEKFNWFTFKRKNYLIHPEIPLGLLARKLISEKYGIYPTGKIVLLTNLSCFNYCFNPISLYFIFKENSDEIDYLIVEVTNTPWDERHFYLLTNPISTNKHIYKYHFKKELHVSPFMAMDYEYQLNLKIVDKKIIVHMKNYHQGKVHFDATLALSSIPTSTTATKTFLRFPFITYTVTAAIYWQAFKLWLKGVSFHPHPKKSKDKSE